MRTVEDELRDVIAACVNAYLKNGGRLKELAEMSGVSGATIKKLAEFGTVHPRFHTIEAVLNAFGRELRLVDQTPASKKGKKHEATQETEMRT